MPGQYILHLAPTGLTAFSVRRCGINAQHVFSPATDGHQAFEAFLSRLAHTTRISLLVDLPDEAHHLESLPFARGRDRQAMLARRQDHLFGDTPFRSHLSLGRENDGRRDERILFAALTRPSAIRPWLQRIVDSPCVLAEMTSISFLSQTLATALQPATSPFLFAHLTPAGLRVSCFENGQLRFSRLTITTSAHPESDTAFLLGEITRSYDYLISQRALPRNHPTAVRILVANQAACTALEAAPLISPGLALQPMRLAEAGAALGLKPLPTDADSLAYLLQALATHRRRRPQFAPAEALAGHRLQQLGHIAGLLAGAIFLACLGYASLNLFEARSQRSLAEASLHQASVQEARLAETLAETPATPQPPEHLHHTLDMLQALATSSMGPEPAMRQLAAALARVNGFMLQEIEWSADLPTPAPPAAVQTLRVRFDLPDGTAHARERASQAHSVLAALETLPGAQIQILHQPSEMSQSEPLRVSDSRPNDTRPRLEVRIRLPLSLP